MTSSVLLSATRKESLVDALPIITGYFVVSFVFGVMCINAGLPLWLPAAMCLFVYAGAAQFAALALMTTSAPLITIALSTLLINSRHMLMAMYMSKRSAQLPISKPQKLLYAFGLTDESFAFHSQRLENGRPTSAGYLLQFNTYCHASWIAGAVFGAVASDALNRFSQFKLDYALTAMMIFVLISLCSNLTRALIALVVIVTTCLLNMYAPSPLNVFIATAVGCGAGLCLKRTT
ncbi:AzlC family ABC transporter permease [Pseudomonas vlassakiae]|uniref:AzlC family ABC transporter permease n=1 Tax=Pseudomonas vlassakiae TaxID=485888 RepID=UPI0021C6EEA6|nr:AzlC family ABC transporter permease [Pseudomonas vlassakiae]MCU0124356.1 AzlC family ABC transporter permease [Pseudomonas vlassakiae]